MLKITRAKNTDVVFGISGRLDLENMDELKSLIGAEAKGQNIVLDLRELTLVDEHAVRFLRACEAKAIELKNCPAYIREWIMRERDDS